MEFLRCSINGKSGVEEIDHLGDFALIANRTLYDHGTAHKFSIVKKDKSLLTDIYRNQKRAENALHELTGQV